LRSRGFFVVVHRLEVMQRVMQLGESRRQIAQAANVEMIVGRGLDL